MEVIKKSQKKQRYQNQIISNGLSDVT